MKKDSGVKKPRFGTLPRISPHKAAIGIVIIIIAYLFLFIFLHNRILSTPDIDRSDAIHFNLSLKYFLWDALQRNTLPFWTDKLQGGFPLLAESQTGALYLPNLIILRLLPFAAGYSFLFVFSLFIMNLGMYLLLREKKTGHAAALFLSVIFTFSGAVTYRWIHFNVIQTISLAPLIFYLYGMCIKTGTKRSFVLLAVAISQLIFAGHAQIAYIVLLGLSLWHIARRGRMLPFAVTLGSGIILALPQIIPTIMLSGFSSREIGEGYSFATSYSLPLKHLLSFFLPYPFGSAFNGTYPDSLLDWGLFWENSPYLGFLFMTGIMLLAGYLAFQRKLNRNVLVPAGLAFFFILLSLGKNSPLYFLFDVPPFSMFRTPPKYLLMATFFIILASGELIAVTQRRYGARMNFGILAVLAVTSAELVLNAFSYHRFLPASRAMKTPDIVRHLPGQGRYVTFGFSKVWHDYMTRNGWDTERKLSTYGQFNEYLIPNSNLMYDVPAFDINTGGLRLRRPDYVHATVGTALSDKPSPVRDIATASAHPFMHIAEISSVISSYPLEAPYLSLRKQSGTDKAPVYLYSVEGNTSTPYYVPASLRNIKYFEEFARMHEENLISTESAIVEDFRTMRHNAEPRIGKADFSVMPVTLSGRFDRETFLAFKINWYPELDVRIDGKNTPSYRVNLINTGVLVPQGDHTVTVGYIPKYFYIGTALACSYSLLAVAVLKLLKK